ncbi:MAG: hypothetical protein M3238_07805, partial [Actinomycetota bacterium]|nr:hypothetical protein [Actinomycetota bacterium]
MTRLPIQTTERDTETWRDDPERYRRTLDRGILVFRWVWLGWMAALAASSADDLAVAPLAWASIGA